MSSTLARLPFFQDVTDLDLSRFEKRCVWRRCEESEVVVDFADASSDVYFIAGGDVRVLVRTPSGKEMIYADLKAGQFFGELSAIDSVPRSANVTALNQAELCIMSAPAFRDMLFSSPLFCDKILHLLTRRVRELNVRLFEQSVFDLRHRLYAELLRLAHPRTGHAGQLVLTPPPFHHVLAARIGGRREQVSREMSALDRDKIVQKTKGALILLQPDVLRARLDQALRDDT